MIKDQINEVVKQLVLTVNGVPQAPNFLYGTKNEINVAIDSTPLPCVLLYNIKPVTLQGQITNSVNDVYELYMEFLFQPNNAIADIDTNTTQNEITTKQAQDLLEQFLIKLQYFRETPYSARFFKIKSNIKYKSLPIYNRFSMNACGVNLTITLTTMNNTGYDPTTRPPNYQS